MAADNLKIKIPIHHQEQLYQKQQFVPSSQNKNMKNLHTSPRNNTNQKFNSHQNGTTTMIQQSLLQPNSPVQSHRSSIPQSNHTSQHQQHQQRLSHASELQSYVNITSSSNKPAKIQPILNVSGQNKNNHAQQALKQQAKSGRIGIFGNYLASRISSIQQQKFLLHSTGGQQTTSANASPGQQQQFTACVSGSEVLSSRMQSNRNSAQNMSQSSPRNVVFNQNKNQNAVTAQQYQQQSSQQQPTNDLQVQPASNSFQFGTSQFGSLSTSKNGQQLFEQQRIQPQSSTNTSGKSPFAAPSNNESQAAKYNVHSQRLNSMDNAHLHQQQLHQEDDHRWVLNADHKNNSDLEYQLRKQQRRDSQRQESNLTYNERILGQQLKIDRILNRKENDLQDAADIDLNEMIIKNPRASIDYKTRPGGSTETTNKKPKSIKGQVLINKSYQGSQMTKILKQVHANSEQETKRQNQQQRPPSLQLMNNQQFRVAGNAIKQPPNFSSGTFGDEMPTSNREYSSNGQQQNQQYQKSLTAKQDTKEDSAKANYHIQVHLPASRLNSNDQKQIIKPYLEDTNNYNSSQMSQKAQYDNNKIRRLHAHTPNQEENAISLSPMQVRRADKNGADKSNSINSAIHRSHEQRDSPSKANKTGAKPLVRDNRILDPINKVFIGIPPKNEAGVESFGSNVRQLQPLDTTTGSSGQLRSNSHRDEIKRQSQQMMIAMNLPINSSKLNAALRQNGRLGGLGPCLEERQMNVIDKIWGNFSTEQGEISAKKLIVTSARGSNEALHGKASQPVQLVNQNERRMRNDLTVTEQLSGERALFLQQNQQQEQLQSSKTQNLQINNKRLLSENTPVWLPKKQQSKKIIIGGSIGIVGENMSGRRSQANEENNATPRGVDEDYKDFNFIVGKQKGVNHLTAAQQARLARSNSPAMIRGRYEAGQQQLFNQSVSENYKVVKQYGDKRLSSDILMQKANGLGQASIKIQIEEQSQQRRVAPFDDRATYNLPNNNNAQQMPDSQINNLKPSTQNHNTFISLSQKKKNDQYWNAINSRAQPIAPQIKDEKGMYHVTIQIDPSMPQTPYLAPKRFSPSLDHNSNSINSPYNPNFHIIKQAAVPIKQHVLSGIPGNYNVNSNLFEANPKQYGLAMHSARIANGVISPRSIERKNLIYSPEPKLIELLPEDTRLKTIPIMYPIALQKRQMRHGKPETNIFAGLDSHNLGMDQSMSNGDAMGQSYDQGFTSTKDAAQVKKEESLQGAVIGNQFPIAEKYERRKLKQPYFCPYARERLAKQKLLKQQKEAREAEAEATEESKTDLRTEEQKKEDQIAHQKELMRKFISKFPPKKLPNIHAELEEERMRFVQARKDANKKYTEISANNNKPGKFAPLKYSIHEGNNSMIVKRVMQSRLACNMPVRDEVSSPLGRNIATTSASDAAESKNPTSEPQNMPQNFTSWQESNAPNLFNFKWKPTSNGINFERLGKFGYKQLVNHIDGHQALTTKDQLFFNMKAYCEKKNLDVYDFVPLTFGVNFQDDNHAQKFDQIIQMLNVFEKNIKLTPQELSSKLQIVQQSIDKTMRSPLIVGPSEHQGKNLWLLKPTGFNRGIGIHVFNSIEDLQNILWTHYRIQVQIPSQYRNSPSPVTGATAAKDFTERNLEMQKLSNAIANDESVADPDANNNAPVGVKEIKNHSFIVQKYIEAPLLYRKRKFDIRIWTLISHDAKFYCFKEAYVRTSSDEYDLSGEKLDQVYVHLTNNAVQKYSKNYGKFEEGNIVSVKALSQELASQEQFASSLTAEQIEQSLNAQMLEQILHSYEAVRSKLRFSKHSFELVGYDFMVIPVYDDDEISNVTCQFKTKLIEANTNPCLEESNQLLKDLIPRMLDDMLKIVLDPLFGTILVPNEISANETESGLPCQLKYPVDGYQDHENMFELIASPVMPQIAPGVAAI